MALSLLKEIRRNAMTCKWTEGYCEKKLLFQLEKTTASQIQGNVLDAAEQIED